jgi:hypothetical protein
VLSGFFGLLSLNAYVRYVEHRGPIAYGVMVVAFALGLLSKTMVVTLPFLMLLLDAWPLARLQKLPIGQLLLEKLPLFAMALVSAVAIYLIQQPDELPDHTQVSLMWRLVNVPISYVAYLGKAAWPIGLACFYPHPGLSTPELFSRYALGAAIASAGMLAVTGVALRQWRTRPWLLVGWLWFVGTLIPMIGIVQVGYAALADRYVYLPLIGIYWIVGAATAEAAERYPRARPAFIVGGLTVAILLSGLSVRQVSAWKDSYRLFEHALAVTERNAFAHNNLGVVKFRDEQAVSAEREFRAAIAIDPLFPDFHHNRAFALETVGKLRPAVAEYREALALRPDNFDSNYQLAGALYQLENFSEAARYFERALEIRPKSPRARRFMNQARRRSRERY